MSDNFWDIALTTCLLIAYSTIPIRGIGIRYRMTRGEEHHWSERWIGNPKHFTKQASSAYLVIGGAIFAIVSLVVFLFPEIRISAFLTSVPIVQLLHLGIAGLIQLKIDMNNVGY